MSREIKFRAGINHHKIMVDIDEGSDYTLTFGNRHPRLEMYSNSGEFIEAISDVAVMQYTGLKDKNGMEIYEGDIVVSGYGDPSPVLLVVYQAPSFVMKKLPHHKTWQSFFMRPDENQLVEVIGSIYENPELLDVQAS